MKKYISFCRRLNQILLGIGIAFLIIAVGLTFVQVVLRNIFHYSFTWAEELTRYLVIYAVYLASGTVLYMDANAKVDMFYHQFPPLVQKILSTFFYVLIAVFLCVMFYYGYIYVSRNVKVYCASIHIPWALPFFSLLIGAVSMLLQVPAKICQVWQDET